MNKVTKQMLLDEVARINAVSEQIPGEVGSYDLETRELTKLLNKNGGMRTVLCWSYDTPKSVIYSMLRAFTAGYDEVRHSKVDKQYENEYWTIADTETP